MRVSIEANRDSLKTLLAQLGEGPGATALAARAQRADLATAQVRTELEYLQPLLEFTRWTSSLHQVRLLTQVGLTESKASSAREKIRHLFEILVIWVTFIQLFGFALSTWYLLNDAEETRLAEAAKAEQGKQGPGKTDSAKAEQGKGEPAKAEQGEDAPGPTDSARMEPVGAEAGKSKTWMTRFWGILLLMMGPPLLLTIVLVFILRRMHATEGH
jgi:hypothetical protein